MAYTDTQAVLRLVLRLGTAPGRWAGNSDRRPNAIEAQALKLKRRRPRVCVDWHVKPSINEAPMPFRRKGCDSGVYLALLTSSFCMAPVLEFLRIIRFVRDYIKRFPGRGATLLAFFGHKLIECCRFWFGKFGRPKPANRPFHGTEASSRLLSGGSAVVSEYVIAASYLPASATASQSSLHELHERRPISVGVHLPVPATLSADPHDYPSNPLGGGGAFNHSTGNLSTISVQSRASDRSSIITNSGESMRASLDPPSRLPRGTHRQFGRGPDPSQSRERVGLTRPLSPTTPPQPAQRSSLGSSASSSHSSFHDHTERQPEAVAQTAGVRSPDSLSVDYHYDPPYSPGGRSPVRRSSSAGSRSASDRLSIITNSGDLRRSSTGQPSRPPRTPHRQFSHDPGLSRSKERPSRSPSPSTRPHTPSHPRLENSARNSLSPTLGEVGPVVQPSASSYPQGLLSPSPMYNNRMGMSFTSLAVDVQNPSTESLAISFMSDRQQLTEEPSAIDYSADHSSPDSSVVNLHVSLPDSPTSSNHPTLDYFIPDGRTVQLINSDQIPRYTKDATM